MSENPMEDKDQKRHDDTVENVGQVKAVMHLAEEVRQAMVLHDLCSLTVADRLLQHAIVVTVSLITHGHIEEDERWSQGYIDGVWGAVNALAFRGQLVARLKAKVLQEAVFVNDEILAEDDLADRAEDVGPRSGCTTPW